MFRFFENLVDPFAPYDDSGNPSTKIIPFLKDYCRPFYGVFLLTGLFSLINAGTELALIYMTGWVVDIMQGDPKSVIAENMGVLIAVAIFLVFLKPIVHGIHVGAARIKRG